jgi:hypothetical protein
LEAGAITVRPREYLGLAGVKAPRGPLGCQGGIRYRSCPGFLALLLQDRYERTGNLTDLCPAVAEPEAMSEIADVTLRMRAATWRMSPN